jgi:hypothetical protein
MGRTTIRECMTGGKPVQSVTKRPVVALARLALARKIAAITLVVWKKGARFDAQHLKQQAA